MGHNFLGWERISFELGHDYSLNMNFVISISVGEAVVRVAKNSLYPKVMGRMTHNWECWFQEWKWPFQKWEYPSEMGMKFEAPCGWWSSQCQPLSAIDCRIILLFTEISMTFPACYVGFGRHMLSLFQLPCQSLVEFSAGEHIGGNINWV